MTRWPDLPNDVVSLILSKLCGLNQDQYHFSLVCKSWNEASAISPYRHSPYLMSFHQWKVSEWKFSQYDFIFRKKFPELKRNVILCSKYGWLLMAGYDNKCLFFFAPFNGRMISLPETDFHYKKMCFFHKPTSPDCFIVSIAFSPKGKGKWWLPDESGLSADIAVLKPNLDGENTWVKYKYHSKTPFHIAGCNPALHRGQLYCFGLSGKIATFDIDKHGSETSWIVHTNCLSPPRLRKKIREYFLIRDGDTLFAVLVAHDERHVNVFKLLEPDMKWEVVKDIGDKVFYVSGSACLAQAVDPYSIMANKIYFPKSHGKDNGVFYSLKTRKYHSINDNYSSKKSYDLTDTYQATWIMPMPLEEF